jgi:hypothetical protein
MVYARRRPLRGAPAAPLHEPPIEPTRTVRSHAPRIASGFARSLLLAVLLPGTAHAQSLLGSRASLDIQNRMAKTHGFTFLDTRSDLEKFVRLGYLVPVEPTADFDLHEVSFPYTRPETLLFVKRLAAQYHTACGEPMVVTSLTRPNTLQPVNASDRSVHPTGMAVDLRLAPGVKCRRWLERVLLDLEQQRVIEATRERRPAHYHIAIFPEPYRAWVDGRAATVHVAQTGTPKPSAILPKTAARYQVRSGDSLWNIARKHGTTVAQLRAKNALASNRIRAGQMLELPVTH